MDRETIIKEAREWIGTRWQHQASLKGVACDCIGLVRGVHKVTSGENIESSISYPATWHLFKDEPRMYLALKEYAGEEIAVEDAQPGDIITFSFREKFPDHHVGILTESGTFIHSYLDVKKVVETSLDDTWKSRLRHAFRFPGVG